MSDSPAASEMNTAKTVDLSNCDREQIQYSAATLEHGFLLVLREPDLTAVQAGENASDFLGRSMDEIIGQSIETWLEPGLVAALRDRMRRSPNDGPAVHAGKCVLSGHPFDVFVHRCGGSLIVEFETRSVTFSGKEHDVFSRVHAGLSRLQQNGTLQEFLDLAVDEIRDITGFDRVLAYQFLEDGSGAVRAESVAGGWESFLGLHYPASDIPLPARRLFSLTWLRHQPDIGYKPVPIRPELNPLTGKPLDLSYALLRSVSVMYSQYLKNMGTQASMVMTVLKNGALWGLIACHHHSGPRHVPFEIRAGCEFLAHMVSLLISALDDQEQTAYRMKLQAVHSQMAGALAAKSDFLGVLIDKQPGLLDFIDAGGAALVLHGRITTIGVTPGEDELERLVGYLSSEKNGQEVFATDCLSASWKEAASYADVASGLLAIAIERSPGSYILWFRPEFRQTVDWAGNPNKPVEISDDGQRLSPRTSFAIWKETVSNKSRPWKDAELTAAREFREEILRLTIRRAEQIQVLYEDLRRTNAELDAFAYIASHDLKEPLRGIHNYAQFVLEDAADTLPADSLGKLRTVVRLTRRMDELLDSLLMYARLGREGMELRTCDPNAVLAEVLDTLSSRIEMDKADVRVCGTLPLVQADHTRLSEVFMNLIVNALKYNDKPRKVVEIGCDSDGGQPVFFVRDNGIGIAPEHRETIFAIFRRLHPPESFGGGTGAGLTITRKILERHGGRVWVESVPGQGSTFRFTIAKVQA